MFDLRVRPDGFEATVQHLPSGLGVPLPEGLLERAPIDGLVLLIASGALLYLLATLYVVFVLPHLAAAPLLLGVAGAQSLDGLIEGASSRSRRLGARLQRALLQRSRLVLAAHRLSLGGRSWPLAGLAGLRATGHTLVVEPLPGWGRPVVVRTNHAPWACARLCALVNAELARRREGEPPSAPLALQRVLAAAARAQV